MAGGFVELVRKRGAVNHIDCDSLVLSVSPISALFSSLVYQLFQIRWLELCFCTPIKGVELYTTLLQSRLLPRTP